MDGTLVKFRNSFKSLLEKCFLAALESSQHQPENNGSAEKIKIPFTKSVVCLLMAVFTLIN